MNSRDKKQLYMMNTLKEYDYATFLHSERVARLSLMFGSYLGFHKDFLNELFEVAIFHDIGKLYVKVDILGRKGKLTKSEFQQIMLHPLYGEIVLKSIGFSKEFVKAVRGHHENYNGTGYPDGVDYRKISTVSSIIRIVDSYDAMISVRSYNERMSKEDALKEIISLKGVWYHPYLVDKFCEYLLGMDFAR